MKQRWVRSPDEHTRCLHPFLATWEEKEWGWGLSQAGVTEACGRRSETLPTPPRHPSLLTLPSVHAHFTPPALAPIRSRPSPLPSLLPTRPHLLAEMPDAADLEGASGLHVLTLEEDSGAGHLGQCPALQQRSDGVEVLPLRGLCQRGLHSSHCLASLRGDPDALAQAAPAKRPLDLGWREKAEKPLSLAPLLQLAANL